MINNSNAASDMPGSPQEPPDRILHAVRAYAWYHFGRTVQIECTSVLPDAPLWTFHITVIQNGKTVAEHRLLVQGEPPTISNCTDTNLLSGLSPAVNATLAVIG